MKSAIIALALLITMPVAAQTTAEIYGDPPELPDWLSRFHACACIKNVDGKCMSFGTGPYPYRQYDEGISGPHCASGCFPQFSDVYGYSMQAKRDLASCRMPAPEDRSR